MGNLSEENEPDIYRAIKTDALLENCTMKEDGSPDYDDVSKTQNGRVSYPIYHIPNYHKPQMAGHPENIIFLTCDAFGVLPPVAKLSVGQAGYHFLSGYTAKVAGTERGITEPTATFSACFGAAFLTLHPTRYADLLQQKFDKHGSTAFLVNTAGPAVHTEWGSACQSKRRALASMRSSMGLSKKLNSLPIQSSALTFPSRSRAWTQRC